MVLDHAETHSKVGDAVIELQTRVADCPNECGTDCLDLCLWHRDLHCPNGHDDAGRRRAPNLSSR